MAALHPSTDIQQRLSDDTTTTLHTARGGIFSTSQRRILLGILCVAMMVLMLVSGGGMGGGSFMGPDSRDPFDQSTSASTVVQRGVPTATLNTNTKPVSSGGDVEVVRVEDALEVGGKGIGTGAAGGDENGVDVQADSQTGNWNPRDFDDSLWKEHSKDAGKGVPHRPGEIPTTPYIPTRLANGSGTSGDGYATTMAEMVLRMERQWSLSRQRSNADVAGSGGSRSRPFRFHVYRIPDKYISDAFNKLEATWPNSICNKKKTNYTLLDWRHAHSLFTADVLMTKYLRFHPSHTDDPDEADIFIIPMMTHVFNCAHVLGFATEILSWVTKFPYYRRYDGHDHFLFWWRWGMHYGGVQKFWKRVQRHFPKANIISFDYLEIMGRNNWQDFTLALKPKFDAVSDGIVMPYPDFSPTLSVPIPVGEIHKPRPLFFYFAGTAHIGGIRRWIRRNCLAHAKTGSKLKCMFADFGTSVVDFARAGIPSDYPSQMQSSIFCGHAAGDALSSRRPTSAVLAGCIPVLICDLCIYAFEQVIDYGSFAIFMKEEDVLNGKMMSILEAIPDEEIKQMQRNLVSVRRRFEYRIDGPPREGDALDTLVSELSLRGRKLRSYKRWWTSNHALSSDGNSYPLDPAPVKQYLQPRSWWVQTSEERAKEEQNFNNV